MSKNYIRHHYRLVQNFFVVLPLLALTLAGVWILTSGHIQESGSDFYKIPQSAITCIYDHPGQISIDKVVSLPDTSFQALPSGNPPNFGFSTASIWLRFELSGNMTTGEKKMLEIKNPLLNVVELYERKSTEIVQLVKTGDTHEFSTRPVPYGNYIIPIHIPRAESRVYYLKVSGGGEQLLAPLKLWAPDALGMHNSEDQVMRGSYFGLILFVLLFNLFVYIIIREKASLYYVHYNLFLLLLQLSLGGYAFQYLWPGSPYLANVANPFFATLSVFALMRFAQHFLELYQFFPRVNRIFQYTGYLLLVNAAASLIWHPVVFAITIVVVNVTALLLNLAIIPVAVGVVRRGYAPAKIFLAAFLLLVVTVFGFVATNAGLIHSEFYADYGLLIGSAVEVVLLSLAIVVRFKQFKEDAVSTLKELNTVQREQNMVLEQRVAQRTFELSQQKEEILSSIRYAERIQQNVLPSVADVKKVFPDSFILYKPKDIVSGDFYWTGRTSLNGVHGPAHEVLLFATGDCTGHGVPGAMLSVLGCNLLRETVMQFPEDPPHQMLHRLDERLLNAIGGTSHAHAGDGMDLALWSLQTDTMELKFAGANTGVSIWRNNKWIILPGTRRPLGLRNAEMAKDFELQSMRLTKGDTIYCWTDGITDQIGGPKSKKLKTRGLLEFLSEIAGKPLAAQMEAINQFIEQWRGEEEQMDDICLSVVRI
ncbi:MAG: 7TM diverse intracellular signaling domain-containing protein [Flavobacteriales bacterium]